jgi:hypothetical protein
MKIYILLKIDFYWQTIDGKSTNNEAKRMHQFGSNMNHRKTRKPLIHPGNIGQEKARPNMPTARYKASDSFPA